MSVFALKRQLSATSIALLMALASSSPIYLTVYVTAAMACFLDIDITAVENYIFTSEQPFNAKYTSKVVSVLMTMADPALEEGLA